MQKPVRTIKKEQTQKPEKVIKKKTKGSGNIAAKALKLIQKK